ncbi:MAG: serine/threonine protein kinase, partial [Paludibacteraceae bacterium]|nr:serine/threonine protein kinase [Paludibacteraceae bacterium]
MSQPTLSIGTKLCGKEITYMVTKILGQGSFGITYKVKAFTIVKGSFGEERYEFPQPKAVKEFFMKELNGRTESGSVTGISSGSLSYNYAQKFRSEAGNLAKMKHQNIVRVIDFIEANGTYYYVMDYVDGENLNEYIKHNKLTENEVVDIIRKVADALIYMHEEQKMLHLDLKPGNIMRRSSDGHIFLIDFGLSKHFSDNGTPETSTTVGYGTAGYAPVEQSNGTASAQFRPTIDVYALGATMYKLLTGETPPTSWMLVHDDDEGFIENSLNRYSVSKKIAKVITKAMSPKVKDRQQSVREFLNEINDLDILVSMTQPTLTIGTELCGENNNVAYKVIQILGQGSFGITYKVKAFTMVKGSFGEERYEFPQPKAVKEFF